VSGAVRFGILGVLDVESSRNDLAIALSAPAVLLSRLGALLPALSVGKVTVFVACGVNFVGVAAGIQHRLFVGAGFQLGSRRGLWWCHAVGSCSFLSGSFDLSATVGEAEGLVLDAVVLVMFEGVVFVTLGNVTVLRQREGNGVGLAFSAIAWLRLRSFGSFSFILSEDFNAFWFLQITLFGLGGGKASDEDAEKKKLHGVRSGVEMTHWEKWDGTWIPDF